jgi:hypothetical protein
MAFAWNRIASVTSGKSQRVTTFGVTHLQRGMSRQHIRFLQFKTNPVSER